MSIEIEHPDHTAVPQGDEVLSVHGVSAALGGRQVLADIDFSIAAGE